MDNTLEPKELSQALAKIISIADAMKDHLLSQAQDAARSGETGWLVTVSGDARDIEECVHKVTSAGERMSAILKHTLGFEDNWMNPSGSPETVQLLRNFAQDAPRPIDIKERRLRKIRKTVSQGEINQNLLTLTEAAKRGYFGVNETLKINLPDGTEFETEIIRPGNRLRERGWIKAFYAHQKICAGDTVVLEEVEPRVWKLSKVASPQSGT